MQVREHTSSKQTKPINVNFSAEPGFTLIETVIALLILTVGLLGVAGAITYASASRNLSRNVSEAKLVAVSMLEQVENLRNTKQLAYKQIANTDQVNNIGMTRPFTGFPLDFQPVATNPGADGIYGTNDPAGTTRPQFSCQVLITPLPAAAPIATANLKKIQVTVNYPGQNGVMQQLVVVGYLNNDARSNYIN